jgi:Nucleotidyl transferase of unknown function (DUF2204)
MKINSDFKDLLSSLNLFQVKYLLVGGYAVIQYTEPRYTKDIDLWIEASSQNAEKIFNALNHFGAPLQQLEITKEDFEKEDYFVQLGREPSRVDILMSLKGVSFAEAWEEKQEVQIEEVQVNVISLAHLKTIKKIAARPQDLVDLAALEKLGKF